MHAPTERTTLQRLCAPAVVAVALIAVPAPAAAPAAIHGWSPVLGSPQSEALALVTSAADATLQRLDAARRCAGRVVSVFLSPTSVRQSTAGESYVVKYQLGYSDAMRCTSTLLVTCAVRVDYRNATADMRVRAHRCSSSEVPALPAPSTEASETSPTPPDGVTDEDLGRRGEDGDGASAGPPWDGEGRGDSLNDFGDLLN